MPLRRRDLMLGGLGAGLALSAMPAQAKPPPHREAESSFGLTAAGGRLDQTASLQDAIDRAAKQGVSLLLPPGIFTVTRLTLKPGTVIRGTPGKSVLRLLNGNGILEAKDIDGIHLSDLVLDGAHQPMGPDAALFSTSHVRHLTLQGCRILNSANDGIALHNCSGRITGCEIGAVRGTALFSMDAGGLEVSQNDVHDCGDNGIQIWRSASGEDGSLVTNNRVSRIKAVSGGSGQNGNGINVFRAGSVLIANNRIADCAFSAIRDNSGDDCQIIGNSCSRLGETAIFVEFSFNGAIVADNVIDSAALGISITNFNDGGRLAAVHGNLVRNIYFRKNGDPRGIGIAVEADCAVTGNVIDQVAGFGIAIGWHQYLRDITATGNLVRTCTIGIAVSVDRAAGYALIANNMVSGAAKGAIRGMQGTTPVGTDLTKPKAQTFANLAMYQNVGL